MGNRKNNYSKYIRRAVAKTLPTYSISSKAVKYLNTLLNELYKRIVKESQHVVRENRRRNLSGREIQAAIGNLYSGELERHAIREGTRTLALYYKQKIESSSSESNTESDSSNESSSSSSSSDSD